MLHIEIETVWRFHKEGSPQTAIVMLGILNEIRKTGKLTSAAEHAHLSYRHVWNLVEQWSDGRIKLAITACLLRARQRMSDVFRSGRYQPLQIDGRDKNEILAFARSDDEDWESVTAKRVRDSPADRHDENVARMFASARARSPY